MEQRLNTLAALLPEDADAALIISAENRRYFTDFVSSLGYLLVSRRGSWLFVDSRYEEAAREQAKNCTVVLFRSLQDSLGDCLKTHGLKRIMLEGSAFTLNDAADMDKLLETVGAVSIKSNRLDSLMVKMRIIKTADEIEAMRKAQKLTEDALNETMKLIREGVTELELALDLEFRMRRAGAESVSFDLIVLTGTATSMPHGVPSQRKVKNGDFVLFDIGATVDGYHSDMTRTVVYGKADEDMKRVYRTVLQAQQNGLDAVRSGAACRDVDCAARDTILQAGFGKYFGHSTGHGVGLEIHEAPSVSSTEILKLQSGMVITVEPGIYLPGRFGVRIEDMVAVTTDGYVNLVSQPKELIEL